VAKDSSPNPNAQGPGVGETVSDRQVLPLFAKSSIGFGIGDNYSSFVVWHLYLGYSPGTTAFGVWADAGACSLHRSAAIVACVG